jgi:hypothetical protein
MAEEDLEIKVHRSSGGEVVHRAFSVVDAE